MLANFINAVNTTGRGASAPRRWFLLGTLPALLFSTLLLGAPAKPQKEAAAKAEKTDTAAATPVGSQTCQACHDEVFKAFERNVHMVLERDKGRGWQDKSCEACHGPGSKHAESTSPADILNPRKLAGTKADKNCLQCHLNQPTNAGRIHGGHARSAVSCASCHTVHAVTTKQKQAEMRLAQCTTCHVAVSAEFQRPHKHNVSASTMNCVDCHNPHGAPLARTTAQVVSAKEPGCLKCHGDKRGPFVYEHVPMRLEGCNACHEPHGSANPRMLTRADIRFTCLECHSNVEATATRSTGTLAGPVTAFHDLRNPRFRNCTGCHVKIHGSNVNKSLLR